MELKIDASTCIKCSKCVKVCPSRIFVQLTAGSEVMLENMESCISCGHCVAVCPSNSVIHEAFPPEKVHPINFAALPTPEQVMLLCKARRSNRAFTKQPVPPAMLNQILEAAHCAPTASNMQQVVFTLITNPQQISEITDYTIRTFQPIVKILENPVLKPILKRLLSEVYKYLPSFYRLIEERKKGNDLILRGATAVILIHTPKDNRFGCQDANLAYQNGSLMAESLGVSQFYTGFVCVAIKQDKKNKLAKLLGINGTIHAGMALGMPSFRYPKYIDRKEIEVNLYNQEGK